LSNERRFGRAMGGQSPGSGIRNEWHEGCSALPRLDAVGRSGVQRGAVGNATVAVRGESDD
jgi:hypothetical protein